MPKEIIRKKIEALNILLSELQEYIMSYENNEEIPKNYSLLSAEKRAEEVVELATRINAEILLEYFKHT